jgi:hypothetical protein
MIFWANCQSPEKQCITPPAGNGAFFCQGNLSGKMFPLHWRWGILPHIVKAYLSQGYHLVPVAEFFKFGIGIILQFLNIVRMCANRGKHRFESSRDAYSLAGTFNVDTDSNYYANPSAGSTAYQVRDIFICAQHVKMTVGVYDAYPRRQNRQGLFTPFLSHKFTPSRLSNRL